MAESGLLSWHSRLTEHFGMDRTHARPAPGAARPRRRAEPALVACLALGVALTACGNGGLPLSHEATNCVHPGDTVVVRTQTTPGTRLVAVVAQHAPADAAAAPVLAAHPLCLLFAEQPVREVLLARLRLAHAVHDRPQDDHESDEQDDPDGGERQKEQGPVFSPGMGEDHREHGASRSIGRVGPEAWWRLRDSTQTWSPRTYPRPPSRRTT